ncbi:hypothetical protein [Symmachiella dynata]|uniref:hypothetical protein n=1 Tax=Symmachiella dynata TaxID=2527995 RepID=UPI0030EEC232
MRMQHWSKWVMALLVNAACVATAHAQDYPVDVTDQSGVYQPQAGTGTVEATQMGTPMDAGQFTGYSSGYGSDPVQPWPEVSPFDNSFDQTYYDEGMWYRRTNRRQQDFYIGVDFFNAQVKRPHSGNDGGFVGAEVSNETSVYDWTAREFLGQIMHLPDKDINNPVSTQEFGYNNSRPAIRGRFGVINPDDSSWEVVGFWVPGDEQTTFTAQGSLDRTPDDFASNGEGPFDIFYVDGDGNPVFTLASRFPDFGRLPFDEGVVMKFNSQSWGSELNFYTTPAQYKNGISNFHASFGVRYLGISEQFGYRGSDSGYSEAVVAPDGRQYQISPYTTDISSHMTSNMVGPQMGLKWALGGDNLKLITEVKGSIAANFESNKLRYTGYGLDPTLQSDLKNQDPLNGRDEDTDVTYAPIFEVSFMAELGVMQNLPVFKRLPGFNSSKFRIGYNYTQAWRIRRPAQAVTYYAPEPRLNDSRDSWHVGGLVAGFTWTR